MIHICSEGKGHGLEYLHNFDLLCCVNVTNFVEQSISIISNQLIFSISKDKHNC